MSTENTNDHYHVDGNNTAPVKASPFELKIGGPDGIDNADVPVRWCITPEFVVQMEKDGITDPHILLVSFNPDAHGSLQQMQRVLVPVAELMTYLRFSKSGDMKIFGWIIDGTDGRKQMHRRFVHKSDGSWRTDLIEYDGTPADDISDAYIGTTREIHIPADVFGAEPNPKLKWFANLWHSDRLQDECHFRKRLALALILKWIPVVTWIAFILTFRVLRGVLLTIGGWKENVVWKYMRKPFDYTTDMSICDNKETNNTFHLGNGEWWRDNRFLVKRKTKYGTHRHIFFQAFNPLVILFLSLMGMLATNEPTLELQAAGVAVFVGYATFFLSCLLAVVDTLFAGCIFLSDNSPTINKFLNKIPLQPTLIGVITLCIGGLLTTVFVQHGLTAFVPMLIGFVILGVATFVIHYVMEHWLSLWYLDPKYNDPTYIRELLCPKDEMNLEPTYDLIPKEQRTVRLWIKKVKNSICRPMQL